MADFNSDDFQRQVEQEIEKFQRMKFLRNNRRIIDQQILQAEEDLSELIKQKNVIEQDKFVLETMLDIIRWQIIRCSVSAINIFEVLCIHLSLIRNIERIQKYPKKLKIDC